MKMQKPNQPDGIKGQVDIDPQKIEKIPVRKADIEGFTAKQEAFIKAYSFSPDGEAWGNASKAARIAGYKHKNAGIYAYQLKKIPKIKAAIEANVRRIMREYDIAQIEYFKNLRRERDERFFW